MAAFIKIMFGQEENINKEFIMQTWTEKEDLGSGIFCYRNVINKNLDIVNRLENTLSKVGSRTGYDWQPAYVRYKKLMPEYRDCVDFKYKNTDVQHDMSTKKENSDTSKKCVHGTEPKSDFKNQMDDKWSGII